MNESCQSINMSSNGKRPVGLMNRSKWLVVGLTVSTVVN